MANGERPLSLASSEEEEGNNQSAQNIVRNTNEVQTSRKVEVVYTHHHIIHVVPAEGQSDDHYARMIKKVISDILSNVPGDVDLAPPA
jgi:hypothetical protein